MGLGPFVSRGWDDEDEDEDRVGCGQSVASVFGWGVGAGMVLGGLCGVLRDLGICGMRSLGVLGAWYYCVAAGSRGIGGGAGFWLVAGAG